MRRVVFTRCGAPTSVLTLADAPRPSPSDGEVLVRVRARPVNPSDELYIEGRYGRTPVFPAVPGFEGAGTIEESRATNRQVGQRVAVSATGTWQEYVVVPESGAIPVPDWLPDSLACQLTVNPLTALLLTGQLALRRGQWLLITAAASALSRMILCLASGDGVRCVCAVRDDRSADELVHLGAAAVVNVSTPSFAERVLELTGGHGVHAVLDSVGGQVGSAATRCVRPGGRMVVLGILDGGPLTIAPDTLVFHTLAISGFWLPHQLDRLAPVAQARLIRRAIDLLGTPGFTPPVAAGYDLKDLRPALQHARRRGRHGKIILTG